jgi:hypothetical protein
MESVDDIKTAITNMIFDKRSTDDQVNALKEYLIDEIGFDEYQDWWNDVRVLFRPKPP